MIFQLNEIKGCLVNVEDATFWLEEVLLGKLMEAVSPGDGCFIEIKGCLTVDSASIWLEGVFLGDIMEAAISVSHGNGCCTRRQGNDRLARGC